MPAGRPNKGETKRDTTLNIRMEKALKERIVECSKILGLSLTDTVEIAMNSLYENLKEVANE